MKIKKILLMVVLLIALVGCAKDEIIDEPIKTDADFLTEAIENFKMTKEVSENIAFVREYVYEKETINITWKSDKTEAISRFGVVNQDIHDVDVVLTATFTWKDEVQTKKYSVLVKAMSIEKRLEKTMGEIVIAESVNDNLDLCTEFNDAEIEVLWYSSNPEIISETGIFKIPQKNTIVTLTVILKLEDVELEKKFEVKTLAPQLEKTIRTHQYVEYVDDLDTNFFDNCLIQKEQKSNKLVIKDGELKGVYYSSIFNTLDFSSVVPSWGAVTSKDATVELEVRVKVNNTWSMYISYGAWGLGKNNLPMASGTHDSLVKLNQDEMIIQANQVASAIQYRVTLCRSSVDVASPKLSLVSFAFEYTDDYKYSITSKLPNNVDYDVPLLHQSIVPVIGGSICSPTSSTMLLKYLGHSFTEYDEYEHRYIANLAKDYGNDIFGNWVYNTVTISSFDELSYVQRMYSQEELKKHLVEVGPVALSVKGTLTSYDGSRSYTTGGHLLVCCGYRMEGNKTIFICNDPALSCVKIEYSEDVIKNIWRMITYVIIKK